VIFLLCIADLSEGRATHCNGGKEIRCAKDDFRGDEIEIKSNCNGCDIFFEVGKWYSSCGWPGSNYDSFIGWATGDARRYNFPAAASGRCQEFFIHKLPKH